MRLRFITLHFFSMKKVFNSFFFLLSALFTVAQIPLEFCASLVIKELKLTLSTWQNFTGSKVPYRNTIETDDKFETWNSEFLIKQ